MKNRLREHLDNLGHQDDEVAIRAQEVIRRYYLPRAIPELVPLCESENPKVRFRAGWLLGLSKAPEAYAILVKQTSDPDPRVRYDAAMALGKLGDLRTLDLLFTLSEKEDPVDCLDSAAGMALGKIGPPALEYLKRLPSLSVTARCTMAYVAQRVGGTEGRRVLSQLLEDPDPQVRFEAEDQMSCLRK